jgi:hypothetical protein
VLLELKFDSVMWPLQNVATFKEVVEIPDEATRAKIHATFRIGYIRDAVLPRALDDATFAALHTTMIFNYMDILQSLQNAPAFFRTLFAKLNAIDMNSEDASLLMSLLQVFLSLFSRPPRVFTLLHMGACCSRTFCPLPVGSGVRRTGRGRLVYVVTATLSYDDCRVSRGRSPCVLAWTCTSATASLVSSAARKLQSFRMLYFSFRQIAPWPSLRATTLDH